jgi:hypothetical protein
MNIIEPVGYAIVQKNTDYFATKPVKENAGFIGPIWTYKRLCCPAWVYAARQQILERFKTGSKAGLFMNNPEFEGSQQLVPLMDGADYRFTLEETGLVVGIAQVVRSNADEKIDLIQVAEKLHAAGFWLARFDELLILGASKPSVLKYLIPEGKKKVYVHQRGAVLLKYCTNGYGAALEIGMDGQTDCCLTENESLFFEGTKNKLKYLQECKNVADNGYPNPIKLLANPEEVDDTALLLVVPRFTPNHRQILCRVMTSLQVSDDLRLVRPNHTLRSEIEAVRERSESEYRRLESLIAPAEIRS